ncbi:unnamed protein product [Echinostoma caproni]|uniref:Uncharacterized protein n=1 Tax=Echinostoma caproni TaxID=27848 RepID=A0A183ACB5_9TREM|nr:unnamed protein product [Echinostoma caproni]
MDSQFVFVDNCQGKVKSVFQSPAILPDEDSSTGSHASRRPFKQRARCKLKTSPTRPSLVRANLNLRSGRVHLGQTGSTHNEDPVNLRPNKDRTELVDEGNPSGTWLGQSDVENHAQGNRSSERLAKRRTSLHGKTITVRISRNETKYRKFQAQTYNFLERPKSWPSIAYHVLV